MNGYIQGSRSLPAWLFRRFVPEFAHQLSWHNRVNFNFGTDDLAGIVEAPVSLKAFLEGNAIVRM